MLRSRFCILCGVVAALVAWLVLGAPQAANAQAKAVSFINDVAPILKENCFACHDGRRGHDVTHQTGELHESGDEAEVVPIEACARDAWLSARSALADGLLRRTTWKNPTPLHQAARTRSGVPARPLASRT